MIDVREWQSARAEKIAADLRQRLDILRTAFEVETGRTCRL